MIKNIVLVGAGQLATQFGKSLAKSGFNIRQVYSKTPENAEVLAEQLNAYAISDLNKIQDGADLYILAVKDSVLLSVIDNMPAVKGIVVHTAGSLSIDMLIKFDYSGILYPFQTFSKERDVDFNEIPLLIEANEEGVLNQLVEFSNKVSNTVLNCNSNQRQQIHLAAVFACNFTNHMYAIANNILQSNDVSFDVIRPLIKETANKIEMLTPVQAQTGPAVRRDLNIINKHLDLLSKDKELSMLYKKLSYRIEEIDQIEKSNS